MGCFDQAWCTSRDTTLTTATSSLTRTRLCHSFPCQADSIGVLSGWLYICVLQATGFYMPRTATLNLHLLTEAWNCAPEFDQILENVSQSSVDQMTSGFIV